MALAVGSLSDLGYIAEVTFGVTPDTPSLKRARRVSTSLNLTKDAYESEEIRTDRMTADMRHGVRRVAGDIQGELAVGSYDDFIEAFMGGTWTTGVTADESDFTSVTSDSGTKTFTIAGGSYITKGFRVGDIVQWTNLAASGNNAKNFTILELTATVMTVAEAVVTDAVADSAFDLAVMGKKLTIGNTYRSFTMERAYTDVDQYQVFKGVRINSLELDLPPTGLSTVTFGCMGQDMAPLSGTPLDASYTAASTNAPLAAVSGVIRENGIVLATVTGFNISGNNNFGGKPVVGSNLIPDLLWGNRQQLTGQLTVIFENEVLFNKFNAETETSLEIRLDDPNGTSWLQLSMHRLKYSSGDIADADPQGLPVTLNFTALAPTATNVDASSIVFQRSNA